MLSSCHVSFSHAMVDFPAITYTYLPLSSQQVRRWDAPGTKKTGFAPGPLAFPGVMLSPKPLARRGLAAEERSRGNDGDHPQNRVQAGMAWSRPRRRRGRGHGEGPAEYSVAAQRLIAQAAVDGVPQSPGSLCRPASGPPLLMLATPDAMLLQRVSFRRRGPNRADAKRGMRCKEPRERTRRDFADLIEGTSAALVRLRMQNLPRGLRDRRVC